MLSQHPNINGVKEASGNFSLIAETASLCGEDLNLWSGNDDQTVPMMALGAKGLISAAANLIPGPMAEMTHHMLQGKELQARADPLAATAITVSAVYVHKNQPKAIDSGVDPGLVFHIKIFKI